MSLQNPIKFTCPKCGHHRIEEVLVDVITSSEIIVADSADGPCYEYIKELTNSEGSVERYQCLGCGWTIVDDTVENEAHTEDGVGIEALISKLKELNGPPVDDLAGNYPNDDPSPPMRSEVMVKLSFDLDEITVGSEKEQQAAAIEVINLTLQREPFGLGARLDEV